MFELRENENNELSSVTIYEVFGGERSMNKLNSCTEHIDNFSNGC